MGNYYEGEISIALKLDTPHEILIDLIHMSYWQNKMLIPEKYKEEPIFKNENFNRLKISYGFVFKENENVSLIEYENEPLCELFQDEPEKWKYLVNYYVKINVCLKGYKNLIEEFIDWIRPYTDSTYNYLGNIKDEDGYYNKDFYLDFTSFKKEIEESKMICKGCDNFWETSLCRNYKYCKQAFEKGKLFKE
jgi:hypothetical protein